ncbi:MAG TPA: RodZ domain-containing protein [Desulfopila sp.]|nr:RodZ domain-containing protein [Desulfopila sp.]
MTEDLHTDKKEALGEYLRRQRKEQDLSFEDLQKATKIPARSLRAMEENDPEALPAVAFARGFYLLYAKYLGIDTDEVLKRFESEQTCSPSGGNYATPSKLGQQVDTMAARPSRATASAVGFTLVLIIAAIALFSWYFSWNPATFLSEKIQGLQEQTTTEDNGELTQQDISVPLDQSQESDIGATHFLTVDFLEDTPITVAIDDTMPEKEVYTKGSTRSWYADETISVILPTPASVEVFFNGSPVPLPKPRDGVISLRLP